MEWKLLHYTPKVETWDVFLNVNPIFPLTLRIVFILNSFIELIGVILYLVENIVLTLNCFMQGTDSIFFLSLRVRKS